MSDELTLLDLHAMQPDERVTSGFIMEIDGTPFQFGLIPAHVGCLLRTRLAPERTYRKAAPSAFGFRCDLCGRRDYMGDVR